MDKLVAWVLAGLLAYVCLVLTSINGNLEALNASGTQVSVLSEVKQDSYRGEEPEQIAYQRSEAVRASPVQAGFIIATFIAIFLSWHFSRLYHTHQWTKKILRKSFAPYREPYITAVPREPVHLDQDCVSDAPLPDGRVKESWLPGHAKALYATWGGRNNVLG